MLCRRGRVFRYRDSVDIRRRSNDREERLGVESRIRDKRLRGTRAGLCEQKRGGPPMTRTSGLRLTLV